MANHHFTERQARSREQHRACSIVLYRVFDDFPLWEMSWLIGDVADWYLLVQIAGWDLGVAFSCFIRALVRIFQHDLVYVATGSEYTWLVESIMNRRFDEISNLRR